MARYHHCTANTLESRLRVLICTLSTMISADREWSLACMCETRDRLMFRALAIGILLAGLAAVVPTTSNQEISSPPFNAQDTRLLVQNSTQVTDKNWSVQAEYEWNETDVERDGTTKTFEELMILGSRYEHLVAMNGQPLAAAQQDSEKQKLLQVIARRRAESTQERNKRIAKEQSELNRDHALLDQIAEGMEFSYLGEQQLDGRAVYVVRATPKPGYRPPNKETEVLKGAEGQLWIDKETLNWVKVEAQVVKPIWIIGFIARIEPGTHFELEMMPISGTFWMPKHFSMKASARLFLLFPHTQQEDQTYSEYHKAADYREISEPVNGVQ